MPEIDGYELCRRIRAHEKLADLPVILLTALADPEDVFKGLECGADNFITKPYEQTHLLARIQYLLANVHLRQREKVQTSMEVFLAGRKHVITSDRAQILNLLLSTYEAAVQKNGELTNARDELTKLNERLKDKAAQLEAANKELEAFSYSVSHDLRAPLRAINAFSMNLLKEDAPHMRPAGRELLDRIVSSGRRMTQIIDDLIRLSQLGRQRLSKQPVTISSLVQTVIDELRAEHPNRHIQVQVRELPDCFADRSLLNQVLVNLLSNAFKFTLNTANPLVEIGCSLQNNEKVYFVRDNGAGFDMQYAQNLFGAFQRLHSEDEFQGTGIGLTIVQRIIQRHGGRVWAKGEVDKGATFYFTLPE